MCGQFVERGLFSWDGRRVRTWVKSKEPSRPKRQRSPSRSSKPARKGGPRNRRDLLQTINDIIREGTARRITVVRNDRLLIDIPLVVGMAASAILAFYMPILSALVAVGALFGGCTVRIERDEPSE